MTPSLADFKILAKQANLIPVWTDLIADSETPISVFAKIQEAGSCFLFESAETNEQLGRYSFIGLDPLIRFESKGTKISLTRAGKTETFETKTDPLQELQSALSAYRVPPSSGLNHFAAGAIGYIGFESVHFFEPTVPLHQRDDLRLPDMIFVVARTMIVFDHRYRRMRLIRNVFVGDNEDLDQAYAERAHGIGESDFPAQSTSHT